MSETASALIAALMRETAAAAGKPTAPVSVQIDWSRAGLNDDAMTQARVRIDRVTKTLVFAQADLTDADGGRASAAAVFKILA